MELHQDESVSGTGNCALDGLGGWQIGPRL